MKKLLFVALVAVGMTACMQNEELAAPKGDAIAFENAYVGNSVRAAVDPSQTTNSIDSFNVWGYMNNLGGTVFEGTEVTKNGNVWGYVGTQYWMPGNEYHFSALSPINGGWTATTDTVEGLSNVEFTNDGTVDLLYAHENVSTVGKGLNDTYAPVALEFEHLLSKVKFTFVNGFGTDNNTVEIKNLTMTAPKSATINLTAAATKEWELGAESVALSFGDVERLNADNNNTAECANECLTIPADADYTYSVKFDVYVYVGTELALKVENKEATISGYALEMGNAYNFTAEITPANLGLAPIEFTATVQEWDTTANGNVGNGKAIKTVDDLKNAVRDGGYYALAANLTVDADETLLVAAGKTVVLDMYGFNITSESDQTGSNRNLFDVRGTLTINGGSHALTRSQGNVISYKHVGTDMGWGASTNLFNVTAGGVLNLNGVTAKNEGGSAMAFVAHLNNWGKCTLNVNNSTLESTYIAVRVFNSGYDMNNVTIKGSTLKGKYCFWVHNYKAAGDSAGTDETLNLSIYNGEQNSENIFKANNNYKNAPALFGFNEPLYYDEYGKQISMLEDIKNPNDATEVLPGVGMDSDGAVVVTEPVGLASLSLLVDADEHNFAGKTVKLDADIDLSEENWDPIGDNRTDIAFSGVFDGQDHTIKGLAKSSFDGSQYGSHEGWGLFSVLDEATVKNLKVDGATFGSYTVISGVIAGYAYNTTFENIDITNSKVAGYNWYTGGVVGWAAGECTFKNVNLDETVAVGSLWDSHGQSAGGIAGGVSASAKITIEDCNIACVLDVINDVTSNYKWNIYRVAGMIIGNTNTTETKYNEVVTATATNVTCKNVTVTYGKWANYHYCEGFWNRGWGRYESSDYIDGVGQNEPHNHADGEEHCVCIPFDQLFGGSANGSGHYPVKGLAEFPGVTVVYPAEYTCPVCGQQHNNE